MIQSDDTAARPLPSDARTLPTIEGERVRLRWLEPRDAPALLDVFGDSAVMRYWAAPPLRGEADAALLLEEIARRFQERSGFRWGVARRSDDAVIGTVSLYALELDHARAELGFAIGRAHWGQGLAGEAVRLAISFAFETMNLSRLEADVDPRNESSLRLLERLGFVREGYLRERYRVNGEIQDSVILGLLRRERHPSKGPP